MDASNSSAGQGRDIIVIGASAGGSEAVTCLLQQLGPDLRAAIFVVCHLMPEASNHLVEVFNAAGRFMAKQPADNEEFEHGIVRMWRRPIAICW